MSDTMGMMGPRTEHVAAVLQACDWTVHRMVHEILMGVIPAEVKPDMHMDSFAVHRTLKTTVEAMIEMRLAPADLLDGSYGFTDTEVREDCAQYVYDELIKRETAE